MKAHVDAAKLAVHTGFSAEAIEHWFKIHRDPNWEFDVDFLYAYHNAVAPFYKLSNVHRHSAYRGFANFYRGGKVIITAAEIDEFAAFAERNFPGGGHTFNINEYFLVRRNGVSQKEVLRLLELGVQTYELRGLFPRIGSKLVMSEAQMEEHLSKGENLVLAERIYKLGLNVETFRALERLTVEQIHYSSVEGVLATLGAAHKAGVKLAQFNSEDIVNIPYVIGAKKFFGNQTLSETEEYLNLLIEVSTKIRKAFRQGGFGGRRCETIASLLRANSQKIEKLKAVNALSDSQLLLGVTMAEDRYQSGKTVTMPWFLNSATLVG